MRRAFELDAASDELGVRRGNVIDSHGTEAKVVVRHGVFLLAEAAKSGAVFRHARHARHARWPTRRPSRHRRAAGGRDGSGELWTLVEPYSSATRWKREKSGAPSKPCMRISRTRLTSGVAGSSIMRSPRKASQGTESTHAGGSGQDVRSTRGSTHRPHPVATADPCAQRATTAAAAGCSRRSG